MTLSTEYRFRLGLNDGDPQHTEEQAEQLQECVYGYALRFNEDSVPLWDEKGKRWFIERIAPDAVSQQLLEDLLLLYNHKPDAVLASRRAGNLSAWVDDKGVYFYARMNATSWARDAYQLVADGTLQGCSFLFVPKKDEWTKEKGYWVRTLREIASISELSVVLYPAYPTTDVEGHESPRSVEQLMQLEQQQEQQRMDAQRAYMQNLRDQYTTPTA